MGYTPTEWATGDTITASKLNKIESGIANAGGSLICNTNYSSTKSNYVLDKTVQEIYDALQNGTPVYIKYQYGELSGFTSTLYLVPVVLVYSYDNLGVIRVVALKHSNSAFTFQSQDYLKGPGTLVYSASNLNDYPEFYASVYPPGNTQTVGGIG